MFDKPSDFPLKEHNSLTSALSLAGSEGTKTEISDERL